MFFDQLARVAGWRIDWSALDYEAFIAARFENLRTGRGEALAAVLAAAVGGERS